MSKNYSAELGRLLVYIADVATAIRKNSAYNDSHSYENRENLALDVMWLADSLHCLDRLGRALLGAPESEIIEACNSLIGYYQLFTEGPYPGTSKLKGDPKASIERYEGLFSPHEAIEIFRAIRSKATGNGPYLICPKCDASLISEIASGGETINALMGITRQGMSDGALECPNCHATYVPVLGISSIEQLRAAYPGDEAQAILDNTNIKVVFPSSGANT